MGHTLKMKYAQVNIVNIVNIGTVIQIIRRIFGNIFAIASLYLKNVKI